MSKRSIIVSLLMLLVSACASQVPVPAPASGEDQNPQPVLLTTVESVPVATATPVIVMATETPAVPTATFITVTPPVCLGAPEPHIAVGQQVTVVVEDFDKLKLRTTPKIATDTEKMELDKFTQLKILEGPVCVFDTETGASYWFWKVGIPPSTDIGWVAEGDSLHYFIE